MAVTIEELQANPDFQQLVKVDPRRAIGIVRDLRQSFEDQIQPLPEVPKAPDITQNIQSIRNNPELQGNVDPTIGEQPVNPRIQAIQNNAIDLLNQPEPVKQPNAFDRFGAGFSNAATGFTNDEAARQAEGISGMLGTVAGSFVPLGVGAGGGALAGSAIPGLGTGVGALGGLITAGGATGGLQEAQRERLANEEFNLGKVLGAGGIGALSSIPFGGPGATIGRSILKNAAIDAGINAVGDVALQGIEQGGIPRNLDLKRTATAAGIGGVGGGISGTIAFKLHRAAPDLARKIDSGAQVTEKEIRQAAKILTPDEVTELNAAFNQRTKPEVAPKLELPDKKPLDIGPRRVIDPATEQPFKPVEGQLRSAKDIALDKAYNVDLGGTKATDITPPARPEAPGLLGPDGAPLGRVDLNRTIDLPNRMTGGDLITPERPMVDLPPSPHVVTLPTGAEVFRQGGDEVRASNLAEKLNTVKEDGSGQQVVSILDAQKLIQDKVKAGILDAADAQKQNDILNLFVEAGRKGQTIDLKRREIQEGLGTISKALGKDEVKNRTGFDPFAVTVVKRTAGTEISSLVKSMGSPEAVQTLMRDRAYALGITPTTEGRTIRANAKYIAEQIRNHPVGGLDFTDIYLNGHNFKTGGVRTSTDAPRGYPLRTFEAANIGKEASQIGQNATYTNQISQSVNDLVALAADPSLKPEVQKVLNDFASGKVTKAGSRKLKKLLESSPEALAKFCKTLGI